MHVDDSLGRLAVTDEGLARREALVLDTCLAAGVPVAGRQRVRVCEGPLMWLAAS